MRITIKHFFFSLLCSLFLSHSIYTQNILFVGGSSATPSTPADVMMLDSLEAWGYNASYISYSTYNNGTDAVYEGMDAVFFNETVGASFVRNFGPYRDHFPLPSVVLEAGALENHDNRWNMFTGEGGIVINDTPEEGDFYIQVSDTSHYITQMYNQDTLIKWSKTTDYGVVPFVHGFQYDMQPLGKPLTSLESPDAFTMGALEDEDFPNRMFYFGITYSFIHDGVEQLATPDFFHLIRRGTEWVLGVDTLKKPTCKASFVHKHLSGVDTLAAVSFQFADSSKASSDIVKWKWHFGDGDSSDVQHPVKSYGFYNNSPDSFLVRLTIRTDEDCISDTSQYVHVGHLRPGCEAMYTYEQDSAAPAGYYQFTNTSEADSIVQSEWTFGYTGNAYTTNPNRFIGMIPGDSSEVRLAIETISGCIDSVSHVITHMPDAEKKNILLVGNAPGPDANQFDKAVMDSLVQWGYATSYVQDSVFNERINHEFYQHLDGIFFSATTRENLLKRFASDDYPVPCVNLNIHTLKYEYWRWINSNGLEMSATIQGTNENNYVIIKSKSHYVTGELEAEEIQWSLINKPTDIIENIPFAVKEANVPITHKLAGLKSLKGTGTWHMMAVDSAAGDNGLPNKIFVWGLSVIGVQGAGNDDVYASAACWNILRRAADWTYNTVDFTPPTGINQLSGNPGDGFHIYPNPAGEWVHIDGTENMAESGYIGIMDLSGKMVESIAFEPHDINGGWTIDIRRLPEGLYVIKMQTGNRVFYQKLLIKKSL